MRSYKDKEGRREGIRAIGKQAQRNRVGIRDGLRCQTGGHEGTEVMVGRRVETDEQRAKHHREESRKEKQNEKKERTKESWGLSNKQQGREEDGQDPGPRRTRNRGNGATHRRHGPTQIRQGQETKVRSSHSRTQ